MIFKNSFQFPTNGKAHSDDRSGIMDTLCPKVSIPYEREGTFRQTLLRVSRDMYLPRFNSLRTGRHIQTEEDA